MKTSLSSSWLVAYGAGCTVG